MKVHIYMWVHSRQLLETIHESSFFQEIHVGLIILESSIYQNKKTLMNFHFNGKLCLDKKTLIEKFEFKKYNFC